MSHAEEPWVEYTNGLDQLCLVNPDYRTEGTIHDTRCFVAEFYGEKAKENRERIRLMSNACAGIPNEALESGAIQKLINAVEIILNTPYSSRSQKIRDARDNALDAIHELKSKTRDI